MKNVAWPALVPELSCKVLEDSLSFYCDLLGFEVLYARPERQFAYLTRDGIHVMLEQVNANWKTGPLERPFGRGLNFQIEIDDVRALRDRLISAGIDLFEDIETAWYRRNSDEVGQMEFLVQDPDGYLLRFCQSLGTRPLQG